VEGEEVAGREGEGKGSGEAEMGREGGEMSGGWFNSSGKCSARLV
jgi:hypothetical protein